MLFQEPASPVMEGIIEFHHDLMFVITFITFFVLYMITIIVAKFKVQWGISNLPTAPLDRSSHNTTLEIVWTIIPRLILLLVAVPSFALLYSIDELTDPYMTLKAIGHQWY